MPLIPTINTLFYFLFKFLCYSFYAKYVNRLYSKTHNIWKVGIARALLGLIVSLAVNILLLQAFHIRIAGAPYFLLLAFLVVGEWLLLIWYFYDRELYISSKLIKATLLGTLISFIVDIPLLLSLLKLLSIRF